MSLAVAHLMDPPAAQGTGRAGTQAHRKRHTGIQAHTGQQEQGQRQQQQRQDPLHGLNGEQAAMKGEEVEGTAFEPERLHTVPGTEAPHTVVRAGEGKVTRVVVFNPLAQELHQVRWDEMR